MSDRNLAVVRTVAAVVQGVMTALILLRVFGVLG